MYGQVRNMFLLMTEKKANENGKYTFTSTNQVDIAHFNAFQGYLAKSKGILDAIKKGGSFGRTSRAHSTIYSGPRSRSATRSPLRASRTTRTSKQLQWERRCRHCSRMRVELRMEQSGPNLLDLLLPGKPSTTNANNVSSRTNFLDHSCHSCAKLSMWIEQ